ncbi:MAG: TolC family protein, partial [Archangium sp.]
VMAQLVFSTTNNSTTTGIGSPVVDLPRIGATAINTTIDWMPAPSTTVAVGVRQQLYDFGRTSSETDAARARTAIERIRLELSAVELRIAVTQAWYQVQAARAVLKANLDAVNRAKTHHEFISAAVGKQLRAPVDASRALVEVQRADVARLRGEAQLAMAQQQLGALVGVDGPLDATGEGAPLSSSPSLDAFVADANVAPRIREVEARARAQQAQADAVSTQWRPSLMATAALSSRAGGATPNSGPMPFGDGWLPVVPNWDVGVLLSWQALDPVTLARADAANAAARAGDAEVDVARQNERMAASLAWLEFDTATKTQPALQSALDGAVAAQQQAEARFRLGLATMLELSDAERLRTEAEMQLALGQLAVARAQAALERFKGTP